MKHPKIKLLSRGRNLEIIGQPCFLRPLTGRPGALAVREYLEVTGIIRSGVANWSAGK